MGRYYRASQREAAPGRNIIVVRAARKSSWARTTAPFACGWDVQQGVDNGASVAVLVRVAEALSKARAKRRVRIVFFDMEELGLLGSARYVQDHSDRKVLAMVNLDVNAFGDTLVYGPRTSSNDAVFRAMQLACAGVARSCVEFPRMPSGNIAFRRPASRSSIATVPEPQAHQLWLVMNGGLRGLQDGFSPRFTKSTPLPTHRPFSSPMRWLGSIARYSLVND
jgi:hypothetical protein